MLVHPYRDSHPLMSGVGGWTWKVLPDFTNDYFEARQIEVCFRALSHRLSHRFGNVLCWGRVNVLHTFCMAAARADPCGLMAATVGASRGCRFPLPEYSNTDTVVLFSSLPVMLGWSKIEKDPGVGGRGGGLKSPKLWGSVHWYLRV